MGASGFIDLQVNGHAGVDFTSPTLTLEQVLTASQNLSQCGTAAFLATIVTAPWATYKHTLPLLAEAAAHPKGKQHILGIHLEGPYISAQDGARGVHPQSHIRIPSTKDLETLFTLSEGQIRLITLAPELPGAIEMIHWAREKGVAISIGHTMADSEVIARAVEAGARLSTHLGNGCPNMIHRHQNTIWPQLAHPDLTAMLITDGHHLPADFVKTVWAAKGTGQFIVTSDAAPAAGLPAGEYSLFGLQVVLESNGRLHSPSTQTLAGSASTMLDCMNWLASLGVLNEAELWTVGRDNPLKVLGISNLPAFLEPVRFHQGRFHLESALL